jgi:replicative DNA helicase
MQDKRPILSDLRDSGAIEQDADSVIFVHNSEFVSGVPRQQMERTELIVAKHRNGATGIAHVLYKTKTMEFHNMEWRHGN